MISRGRSLRKEGASRFFKSKSASSIHEPTSTEGYFNGGLFRTSSGPSVTNSRREKIHKEFSNILASCKIDDVDLSKEYFLVAHFGNLSRMTLAFEHGAGTAADYLNWEGDGKFSKEEVERLREFILQESRGTSKKVLKDYSCEIL